MQVRVDEKTMASADARVLIVTKPTIASEVSCDTEDISEKLTKRCVVRIDVEWNAAASQCLVKKAPDVKLKGKKSALLIWDLSDDFYFCPATGDGVFLRFADDIVDDSFDDFGAPNERSGNTAFKRCRNRFRVFAENDVGSFKEKEYQYVAQFRYKNPATGKYEKNVCFIDPFIKNGN